MTSLSAYCGAVIQSSSIMKRVFFISICSFMELWSMKSDWTMGKLSDAGPVEDESPINDVPSVPVYQLPSLASQSKTQPHQLSP